MSQKTDNSETQTLNKLIALKGQKIPAYELSMSLNPIVQVNTVEKNVSYLRDRYGDDFIQSEPIPGKKYYQYWIAPERITALLSDPAEKRVGAQKKDEPAKEVVVREWRQANCGCPKCGGWYQVKKDGEWVCSKKGCGV